MTPRAGTSRRESITTVMPRFKRGFQYVAANDKPKLELPGLCQLDFDPQLNLGQHRVETWIAGGRLQIGRGIAQPVHSGGIEIAGEQPDLELVEHVERAPAPGHRTLAALGPILATPPCAQRLG